MEPDRRVQIRLYDAGHAAPRFGSGYLVGPRLALTAAHVLGDDGSGPVPGGVTVCRPDAGTGQYTGRVRWYRRAGDIDAALVEVDEGQGWTPPASLADITRRPPQRWGRLIGTRRHEVSVVGFPHMQKDPVTGDRDDRQVDGAVHPGTGSLTGHYEVSSQDPVVLSSGSPWAGLSGAAVIAEDDFVLGVVEADRRATGGILLRATRTTELLADDDFRRLVEKHSEWEPVLEPVEPHRLLAPVARERVADSPATLLRADAETVRFRGRDGELRDLRDWCRTDPRPFSVRVLTGEGGQGKTRLARRLADALRADGWIAGHLRTPLADDEVTRTELRTLDTALPLLLVVDYADTRPQQVRRLVEHLRTTRHRARVLLLARADGGWRRDGLAEPYADELLARAEVTALAPLAPADGPPEERAAVFTDAVTDFADALDALPGIPGRPPAGWAPLAATLAPPPGFAHDEDASVLGVQMTALTTLLQHGTAPVPAAAGGSGDPAAVLLHHEQRYWGRRALRLDGLADSTPKAAVAVATLCGAADREEAVAALRDGLGVPAHRAGDVAAWVRSLYPPGPGRYWGALEPDRVGELHVCALLFDDADPLPVPALLAEGSPGQQSRLLTVLVRAATAQGETGRPEWTRHIERELLAALDRAIPHYTALMTLDLVLPHDGKGLGALALRISEERVTAAERRLKEDGSAHALVTYAVALEHLGGRLGLEERHAEAVRLQERAVGLLREAAEREDTYHYRSLYAGALPGLHDALRAVGRDDAARAVLDEATAAAERLADAAGDAPDDREDAAWRLYYLQPRLWDAGHREAAIRVLSRQVDLRRRAGKPPGDDILLANSLQTLGVHLMTCGRLQEALDVTEESVEHMRHLARANPAGFEPWLISALMNQSSLLGATGRTAEAVEPLRQAVAMARHRVRIGLADPSEEHRAAVLGTRLGILQREAGQVAEGVESLVAARNLWRRLAAADPEEHGPGHARSQLRLGQLLVEAGRTEEAVEATGEAVVRWHTLRRDHPGAHGPELAAVLTVHASLRWLAGDLDGALEATGEAVEIYRGLTGVLPDVVDRLHPVLELQAQVLLQHGRDREAEAVVRWLEAHPAGGGGGAF
ncbi:trypsin-like peptidase domain-containing protein [Streptomyces sp. CA-181903]|uniref:trypsin-like peptidase domain-containing protein n=1 Tax=Streptomyces sp. CA-181903 TaxID=3240055 RepID=UPI003D919B97